jgi:hypothetical protein
VKSALKKALHHRINDMTAVIGFLQLAAECEPSSCRTFHDCRNYHDRAAKAAFSAKEGFHQLNALVDALPEERTPS